MIDRAIIDALSRIGCPFKVLSRDVRRYLGTWMGGRLDTVSAVDDPHVDVTIMRRHDDGRVGCVTLTLDPTIPTPVSDARIAQAVEVAGSTTGPGFDLLKPGEFSYPDVPLLDEAAAANPEQTVRAIVEELRERVSASRNLTLASAEVNLRLRDEHFDNYEGLSLSHRSSVFTLYLIFLSERTSGPFDHRLTLTRRLSSDLHLDTLVDSLDAAEDGPPSAQLPATRTGPLVMKGTYLKALLRPLLFHASAEATLRGLSRFTKGAPIAAGGESLPWLSVTCDSRLPGGLLSWPYDSDGVPGQVVTIVEAGLFRQQLCPLAFARRLNVPPTGGPGNIVVPPGDQAAEELLSHDGPIIFVHEFSHLSASPLMGTFSGEIRNGLEYDGANVRRIQGGAVSGNVFALLPTLRLSREELFDGDLLAAKALRLDGVNICGS